MGNEEKSIITCVEEAQCGQTAVSWFLPLGTLNIKLFALHMMVIKLISSNLLILQIRQLKIRDGK